jgi:hypothetical protein
VTSVAAAIEPDADGAVLQVNAFVTTVESPADRGRPSGAPRRDRVRGTRPVHDAALGRG